MTIIIRNFLGWQSDAPWMAAAIQGQIKNIPNEYNGLDVYRIFFTILAIVNVSYNKEHWKTWDNTVGKVVTNAQRKDGDFKGSWDLTGCSLDSGGRVLYTAMLTMYLNIYPRHQSVIR